MAIHSSLPAPYLLAILLLIAAAVLAVLRPWHGNSRMPLMAGSWCLIITLLSLVSWHFRNADPIPRPVNRPVESSEDGFVTSRSCRNCHQRQHQTWYASYHRTMTQRATPETVIGDFGGATGTVLNRNGHSFHIYEKDQGYHVSLQDDVGRLVSRPIVMTTGAHHMQVYWFATGNGRMLGQLPFLFLRNEQRWVPNDSSFLHPSLDIEWTNAQLIDVARWNHTCLKCHVTHPKSRIEISAGGAPYSIDTQIGEFGISCESCHGPGHEHVTANQNPLRRYRLHLGDSQDTTIVNPSKLDHQRASQICGICHSITTMGGAEQEVAWREQGNTFRPGDLIEDHRVQVRCSSPRLLLDELEAVNPTYLDDRFWSDGMVRVSGREYSGLEQTPCFIEGELSCLSCHSMHPPRDDPRALSDWANDQLKTGMRTNQACLSCHQEYESQDQLAAHTHHQASSSGSFCYNCHMPHTTYGLQKTIRSHQIDNPSAAVSLETGRPLACNLCHLDKSLGWSADKLTEWYQQPRPELSDDQEQVAASLYWLLSGDAGQRAIIATAMGRNTPRSTSGDQWMAPYLGQLLVDPYDAVRFIAARSLRKIPGYSQQTLNYDFLAEPAMRDAVRQRVQSGWTLSREYQGKRGPLLIEDDGTIRMMDFQRLLDDRNDRRLQLAE
jgi:nitrate/TMAO reductase-like tetraheme cytochrome c subunit